MHSEDAATQPNRWATHPKVELHLHIDLSLSYRTVHELDPSVSRVEYQRDFVAPAKCANLVDYLARAEKSIALMQTRRGLSLAVVDLFKQLQQDSVIYAELRFAPLLHLRRGLSAEEVVESVDAATAAASAATGIESRVILCTLRHFSAEESMETVRLIEAFRGTRVVALDIAGDEAGVGLDAHVGAFDFAGEHSIPRTAHAGEARGPESVRETLDRLHPSRLGHGVRAVEDSSLLSRLRTGAIHLETCPTSNVQTNTCATYHQHPIDRLYQFGVSVGVNCDTRGVTPITLSQEYQQLEETFGWGTKQFLNCNLAAVDAAFLPGELKARLRERLRVGYG